MYSNMGDNQLALDNYLKAEQMVNSDVTLQRRLANKLFYLGRVLESSEYVRKVLLHFGWEYKPEVFNFTRDTYSPNIPNWNIWFSKYKNKSLRYLEIGSFEGMSALWINEEFPSCVITCIDTELRPNLKFNVSNAGPISDIELIEGKSQDILENTHFTPYDVIYIDGSHKGIDVFQDAYLSWQILKPGGMLIFDDYNYLPSMPKLAHHPKFAIDSFLDLYNGEYTIVSKDYQLCILKNN